MRALDGGSTGASPSPAPDNCKGEGKEQKKERPRGREENDERGGGRERGQQQAQQQLEAHGSVVQERDWGARPVRSLVGLPKQLTTGEGALSGPDWSHDQRSRASKLSINNDDIISRVEPLLQLCRAPRSELAIGLL
ncbi:hypothetical protein SVAN01_08066 [Stagonosporopsis vannaccii]|nr:hypothetical protein SVAN01_08066 [Stagonosporopsis vannaccii]